MRGRRWFSKLLKLAPVVAGSTDICGDNLINYENRHRWRWRDTTTALAMTRVIFTIAYIDGCGSFVMVNLRGGGNFQNCLKLPLRWLLESSSQVVGVGNVQNRARARMPGRRRKKKVNQHRPFRVCPYSRKQYFNPNKPNDLNIRYSSHIIASRATTDFDTIPPVCKLEVVLFINH